LPVEECVIAEKPKAAPRQPTASPRRRARRRVSDWNQNFDLKKGPKVWQAAR
jgi:hypothetical protein